MDDIYVEAGGTGEPVVLAHAGVTDSRIWDLAVPVLQDAGYRTIRYDSPGYGRSARPSGPQSLVANAQRVLDSAGADSAHWIGLSQGAATGVDLALAAPARVRSLALVAPGLSGYSWPRAKNRDAMEAAYERGDAHGLAVEFLRRWGPLSFDANGNVIDEPASRVLLEQADWFMEDDLEIDEPPALERLGDILVPTLIVLGDRDEASITDIGHIYAKGIARSRLEVLADADHLLPLRVPETLHQLLLGHLAAVSARP